MDGKKVFQKRLTDMMIKASMTKNELAVLVGISPTMMGKYASGRSFPSCGIGARIASALGCSLDYLFGLSDDEQPIKRGDAITLETYDDVYILLSLLSGKTWDCYIRMVEVPLPVAMGEIYFDAQTGEPVDIPDQAELHLCIRDKAFIQFYRRIQSARKLSAQHGPEVAELALKRVHEEMEKMPLPEDIPF